MSQEARRSLRMLSALSGAVVLLFAAACAQAPPPSAHPQPVASCTISGNGPNVTSTRGVCRTTCTVAGKVEVNAFITKQHPVHPGATLTAKSLCRKLEQGNIVEVPMATCTVTVPAGGGSDECPDPPAQWQFGPVLTTGGTWVCEVDPPAAGTASWHATCHLHS